MVDRFSKETRSKIMASIRGKDTQQEITIRRLLWSEGVRYRIHDRKIFGTPDISIRSKKVAIFLDGCFWHACPTCYKEPKSNTEFWRNKIIKNRNRRQKVVEMLARDNWKVLEFWEHTIMNDPYSVADDILNNLNLDRQLQSSDPSSSGIEKIFKKQVA